MDVDVAEGLAEDEYVGQLTRTTGNTTVGKSLLGVIDELLSLSYSMRT